ncbi:desulfoferrodoxin FeS4 iron-binding domain-containing protein [bacterium]|nr:desulfoferrodoxin FeS4 iron-binding domain-containing protein [bacterium]
MTQLLELYKCRVCENVVEVVHNGVGTLVCCDESMKLMEEYVPNSDNAHFAHVEFLDELTKKITFNHPMTKEHHIEFIEVISNDGKYLKRKNLKENEPCELIFDCQCKEGFYVRLYCNLDGVWVTK